MNDTELRTLICTQTKVLKQIEDELDTLNRILTEIYYLYGEINGYDFSADIKGTYPRKMEENHGRDS